MAGTDHLAFSSLARNFQEGGKFALENTPLISAIAAVLIVLVLIALFPRGSEEGAVYDIGGIPAINAWKFFTKRYDFIQRNFGKSGGKIFLFKVLQVSVIDDLGNALTH